jgi:hypothetical protein
VPAEYENFLIIQREWNTWPLKRESVDRRKMNRDGTSSISE